MSDIVITESISEQVPPVDERLEKIYHYDIEYTTENIGIIKREYQNFPQCRTLTVIKSCSVNVLVDLSTSGFQAPIICINGESYSSDMEGTIVDLIEDVSNESSIRLAVYFESNAGTSGEVYINNNDVLPYMKQAPQCEASINCSSGKRQCRNKSRRRSKSEVRCHYHMDLERFPKFSDYKL